MTTEDYVSFEIAKLLKEKGFIGGSDVGSRCGFYEQNKEYPNQINLVYDDLNNSELEWNECLRFTHQMAMKWLRNVKKIIISIAPTQEIDCKHLSYVATIQRLLGKYELRFEEELYENSYEEVCESAIKYCLTNLI